MTKRTVNNSNWAVQVDINIFHLMSFFFKKQRGGSENGQWHLLK